MKRVEIEELRFQMQGPESWLGGKCVVALCDEIVRLEKAVQAAYCMGWNDMALQEPWFQDEPPVLLPEVQRKLAALAGGDEEEG